MEIKCKKCGNTSNGRSDKLFCSDRCRNTFNQEGNCEKNKLKYIEERDERLLYEKNHNELNRENYIFKSTKHRAKKRNITFNIDVTDIIIPIYCPLLGIKLKKTLGRDNTTPSIDRINPELGYIKGNIWIISWKANRIKSNLTVDELKMFCSNLLQLIK